MLKGEGSTTTSEYPRRAATHQLLPTRPAVSSLELWTQYRTEVGRECSMLSPPLIPPLPPDLRNSPTLGIFRGRAWRRHGAGTRRVSSRLLISLPLLVRIQVVERGRSVHICSEVDIAGQSLFVSFMTPWQILMMFNLPRSTVTT